MFNKTEKLTEVKSFVLLDKTVFFSRSNNVYKYINGISINILDTDETLQNLRCSDGNIFINTDYGKGYYIKNDTSLYLIDPIQHISLPFFLSYERTENGKNAIIKNIEDKNFKNYIFGSSTIFTISKSKYIRWNFQLKIIEAFEFPTAHPLWQFDLGVLGTYQDSSGKTKGYEVRQFVGVSGEELLVLLSDFRFVAIHIQTGQKTKDIHIPELITCTDGDYLSNFSGVHIDVENKRLIWLSGTTLFHIDISTFQLTQIKNHWHVPQSEKWRFMSSTLHKGLLYFTGDKGMEYVVATRIGVMNAETGEILWQQQLKKTGGLPNAPQVSNDKLYVLTVKKELYIFQKENPSI